MASSSSILSQIPHIPSPPDCNYPIVLNPDPILLQLGPISHDADLKRVNGWAISKTDSELIELGRSFFNKLKKKLKNPNSFTKDEFSDMFASYLKTNGAKCGLASKTDVLDDRHTQKLIEKLGFTMGSDVKAVILEACVVLEAWDILEILIVNRLVDHCCSSNLINNLIEKRMSYLILLCVKQFSDIQTLDFLCILKYFLVPHKDCYGTMNRVRNEWESQALSVIEMLKDENLRGKKLNIARDASVLLMVAYDGFSVSELCLHHLLSCRSLDEVMLASCISKLNGTEIRALVRYLGKWLKKYSRFPQAVPCPKAAFSALGLTACEWIPTVEDVSKCLGSVVDEHYTSLVLHPELHEDLRSLEEVVQSLALEARLCGSLFNLSESLTSEHKLE